MTPSVIVLSDNPCCGYALVCTVNSGSCVDVTHYVDFMLFTLDTCYLE